MDFAMWSEKLSVEIDVIDEQHKKLIHLINNIARMLLKQNETEVKEILKDLQDYTITHFTEEENLFKESDYPDVEKHIKEHKFFVEKLDEFHKEYQLNDVSVSLNILHFLKNWLFYHIEIVDNSYSSYVLKAMTK